MKKYFFVFILISARTFFAQTEHQQTVASLHALIKNRKDDTVKVNCLNKLAEKMLYNNPDTAIILSTTALNLSEKLDWKKGQANSLGELGIFHWFQGNYSKALDYYTVALEIEKKLNNRRGIADNYVRMGLVYWNQSDYPKTLDYYLKGLKIYEEINLESGISLTLGNIGMLYKEQGDNYKALEYYVKALKMAEQLKDKGGVVFQISNIGGVYYRLSKNKNIGIAESDSLMGMALDYYYKALKMSEELNDKSGISTQLSHIGNVYSDQAERLTDNKDGVKKDSLYQKALNYYSRSLKMVEELGDKNSVAIQLGNMASLYTQTKKYVLAEKYFLEALKICQELGARDDERQFEEQISGLYEKTGNYRLSLEYYKKSIVLKDSLYSEEKNKEITRKSMNYEFEKKEAAAKAEQDKKDTVTKIVIYSISIGFLIVFILAAFIFRGYRQKKKDNRIIFEQKKQVDEKQKEILDSIHYAKRIQKALLPTEKYMERNLKNKA